MSYSKYRAIPTVIDGIRFDSKKEAKRYQELKLLERAHQIRDLKLQVPFILLPKSEYGRDIKYVADFTYYEGDKFIVEDVKGVRTSTYKVKKRLLAEKYGIKIRET